jgi:hypothetical protein
MHAQQKLYTRPWESIQHLEGMCAHTHAHATTTRGCGPTLHVGIACAGMQRWDGLMKTTHHE